MTTPEDPGPPWFWTRFDPSDPHGGAQLAALRKGIGESPGTVFEMWQYHYTSVRDETFQSGAADWKLNAEHYALTLFALHQQSQPKSMHWERVSPGAALRRLREHTDTSEQALDGQVKALVTSDDADELYEHFRSLVPRLRQIGQGMDYTALYSSFNRWNHYELRSKVQRAWAAHYSDWKRDKTAGESGSNPSTGKDAQ